MDTNITSREAINSDAKLAAERCIASGAELGPCVLHVGHFDKDGYGKRFSSERRNQVAAHRLAYCEHHGITLASINGQIVRHRCDNRACVNPSHLQLGTHADNIRDRDQRGRTARGERSGVAKLSADDVRFILSNHRRGDLVCGAKALAKRFGVASSTVLWIVHGETWAHLSVGSNQAAGLHTLQAGEECEGSA